MPTTREMSQAFRWTSVGGQELTVGIFFIELVAHAALLERLLRPGGMVIGFAGFTLVMYCGAIFPGQYTARRALGWIGGRWYQWAGAAVAGASLGMVVTATTLASGHSIRVVEAVQDQVIAITLGPIVEEICLRGLLVPLLARAVGSAGAVLVTSVLFAFLHRPASGLKLASITVTGAAYGWIRVRSGSTALASVAHTMYNLAVLGFGLPR